MGATSTTHVYVGTYAKGDEESVFVRALDEETGALNPVSAVTGIARPSFLDLGPGGRTLYAVSEIEEEPGGALSAYRVSDDGAELTLLNRQPTGARGPCHVRIEREGRYALVANYAGGAVTVFPIAEDGSLKERSELIHHTGSSVNPDRQTEAHPHSCNLDPSEGLILVPDLGMDRIVLYRLDRASGELESNSVPWAPARPGAGPRHLDFHPSGRWVYVCNELDSTITAYQYDAEGGSLEEKQSLSTLPDRYEGESTTADIHVHPKGGFVYVSNRGHNSLAGFAIDQDGKLEAIGHTSTGGEIPRNFSIHPDGNLVLAANQRTNNVVGFRFEAATGGLTPTGAVTSLPSPVCLKFQRR
jgi:6-phosphogluconolactonase